VVLYFLYDFPLLSSLICGSLTFISSIHTVCAGPYKSKRTRMIKILGDLLLSATWFLHIPIILIEKNLLKETLLADSQLSKYFLFGNIIMIVLSVFNLIFLVEFVCQQIPNVTKFFKTYVLKSKSRGYPKEEGKETKKIKLK